MDKVPNATAAAVIAVVLLGLITVGLGLVKKDNLAAAGGGVVLQVVYSAPTANDAQIALPERVKADLENVGLQHNKIALKRVDSNGKVSTSINDLTPRAENSSSGRVLTSDKEAIPVIDAKIAEIEKEVLGRNPWCSVGDLRQVACCSGRSTDDLGKRSVVHFRLLVV